MVWPSKYNLGQVQILNLRLHWFLLIEIESIWYRSLMIAVLRPSRVERQYYLSRLKISFRDHINPYRFLFLIWRSCIWKRSSNFWCVSVTVVPVFRRLHSLYAGTLEIWQCKLTNHVCVWMFEKLYMIVWPLLKSQKNVIFAQVPKVK